MHAITRRRFLRQAAASTVFPLITVAGTKASGRVLGANDVIRVGVAGIHGQGSAHILSFDARGEQFAGTGAEKANTLLTRSYRRPFVVPEKV